MTLNKCLDEPEGSCPSRFPLRNPLRGDSGYQARQRLTKADSVNNDNMPLTFVTSSTFSESDCASGLTREEFASGLEVHTHNNLSLVNEQAEVAISERAKMRRATPPSKISQGGPVLQVADEISLKSTKSSLASGLERYSSLHGQSDAPVLYSDNERRAKQREIEEAMARTRRSLEISNTFSNISAYNDEPRRQLTSDEREEEARVEAWLQLGALDIQTPESDGASQLSKAKAVPITKKPHALALFPPTSPKTGKLEYAQPPFLPLSPMNNGRHVYGNFIPTSTRDCFAASPPSVSLKSKPIVKDAHELPKTLEPSLRGGGGWWNPMNIRQTGKQSAAIEELTTITLKNSPRSNLARSMKGERPLDGQNRPSIRLDTNPGSTQYGSRLAMGIAVTKSPTSPKFGESWSNEPDQDVIHTPPRSSSKQWELSAYAQFGSVQTRKKSNISTPPPPPPPPSQSHLRGGTVRSPLVAPARINRKPLRTDDYASTGDKPHSVPKKPFVNTGRLSSPLSDVSYSPRTQKKWNRGPASLPPSQLALPPAPPPKDAKSEVASSVGPMRVIKCEYEHERPRSQAESYDDQWEIRSLQFGESVSTAGWAPRQAPAPQVPQRRSENFETEQKEAMVRFRPLCQDVMVQYNAEMSRINRALQPGELSPEQFERQAEHLAKNRENALKYSARSSGYVMLRDEVSILEAMDNPNGYAIYHELLSTTNPTLWSRLESQHGQAQIRIIQARPTTTLTQMPRGLSSLKSARHVGGRIARFIFAAPSDPDLKTFSKRKVMDWDTTSMPLPWMDPMAMVGLSSPINIDGGESWTFGSLKNKDKDKSIGKGKAKSEPGGESVTGYEFLASSDQAAKSKAMVTGTFSKSKTRWTGTTAVPTPLDRPTKPTRQLPSFNPAYNAYRRSISSAVGTDAATEEILWPEDDSEGNWTIPKRAVMRGGDEFGV